MENAGKIPLRLKTRRRSQLQGYSIINVNRCQGRFEPKAVVFCGLAFERDFRLALLECFEGIGESLIRRNKTGIELSEAIAPVVFDDDWFQNLIRFGEEFEWAATMLVFAVDDGC